jgi:putative spermidine/putrescine transport system permease protein
LTVQSRATRISLLVWTVLVVLFLWLPLLLIGLYAFNESNIQDWPISGLSLKWFGEAWDNPAVRDAFVLSVKVGLAATAVAIVLGTALAFALQRFRFFGRDAISFLFVLPIALPGIVTGMSLNRFFDVAGIGASMWTIVIGHATFCMVIVFNNVVARLRRTSPSLLEASQDLGADGWQTFRYVTWPTIATALVAGGLLAFALSFDEVIVTYFTAGSNNTLPLIIFGYVREGLRLPVVNVVVLVVLILTVIPVMISVRLTRDTGVIRRQ